MPQHLGITVGSNSIGWALFATRNPFGNNYRTIDNLISGGVRAFPDGRLPNGTTKTSIRTLARGQRTTRDRAKQRLRKVKKVLQLHKLFPVDQNEANALKHLDPLLLRTEALSKPLMPYELGRAIIHLSKRRGPTFERGNTDADASVLRLAQDRLHERLAASGARTIGEYLNSNKKTGARYRRSSDPKLGWEIYPSRDMIKAEFGLIWEAQEQHHQNILTEAAREQIFAALFDQRPLKRQPPGKCTLEPSEDRLAKALPTSQLRIILERLGQLRLREKAGPERPLTQDEHDLLSQALLVGKDITWAGVRRICKTGKDCDINLEYLGGPKFLTGCSAGKKMAHPGAFGDHWLDLSLDKRDEIIQNFIDATDDETVLDYLVTDAELTREPASLIAGWTPQPGYTNLGLTASRAIIEELEADPTCVYSKACERAGYHHSDFRTGEVFDRLPYYGALLERAIVESSPQVRKALADYEQRRTAARTTGTPANHTHWFRGNAAAAAETGRIGNPTVHAALNQLGFVINEIIVRHGPLDSINISIGRDLPMSTQEIQDYAREQGTNNRKNREREDRILAAKLPLTSDTRLRARLFDEQSDKAGICRCPYSLRPISFEEAIIGHDHVVTHLLPFSATLDDGMANKVLALRLEAQAKGLNSPYAYVSTKENFDDIIAHAGSISKLYRKFKPDALKNRYSEEAEPLDRYLNDTRYIARIAQQYVSGLHVDVTPVSMRLTPLLRNAWRLNNVLETTNRQREHDYRSKIIDAAIVGMTNRKTIHELSSLHATDQQEFWEKIQAIKPPLEDARAKLSAITQKAIVSHKKEHGKGGKFFTDSIYGVKSNDEGQTQLIKRQPVTSLTKPMINKIVDERIREELLKLTEHTTPAQLPFVLAKWRDETGNPDHGKMPIRTLKIAEATSFYETITDPKTGAIIQARTIEEYFALDIVQHKDLTWHGYRITKRQVNQKDWRPEWEKAKASSLLVMRLHRNDTLEIDTPDRKARRLVRVTGLVPGNGLIKFTNLNESGKLTVREKDPADHFEIETARYNKLKSLKPRKVHVTAAGSVSYAKMDKQVLRTLFPAEAAL